MSERLTRNQYCNQATTKTNLVIYMETQSLQIHAIKLESYHQDRLSRNPTGAH